VYGAHFPSVPLVLAGSKARNPRPTTTSIYSETTLPEGVAEKVSSAAGAKSGLTQCGKQVSIGVGLSEPITRETFSGG